MKPEFNLDTWIAERIYALTWGLIVDTVTVEEFEKALRDLAREILKGGDVNAST